MRSYGQMCAAAFALDVVGDRWSLLIVRELQEGPRRWTDLRDGLPGLAKNLMAARLRDLEAAGVIERGDERYALTARGRSLEPVLHALVVWGAPLVADALEAGSQEPVRGAAVRLACRVHPLAELHEADDEHARITLDGTLVEGTPAHVLGVLAASAPR